MYHKFPITIPPPPEPLKTFDCLPVWVLNSDHFFFVRYATLIEKLRDNDDRPPSTLLSLPDIYWIKTHIAQADLPALHAFVFSYFYGILHGRHLHYAGAGLLKIPMAPGQRAWDGGYLYLEYDKDAEIHPEIFGMYGQRFCGLYTRGTWVPRCTNVTQSLLDVMGTDVVPLGRVAVVSYVRDTTDKDARVLCDIREHESASLLELCPEHPIVK
jgi:hypothetical protein